MFFKDKNFSKHLLQLVRCSSISVDSSSVVLFSKYSGNNIDISYCDKQYESLSGGEKQKVDIIIQFSIRDMLSKFLNFSSNILVLDEIFDNLDNIGCQKVLDLISNKLIDVSSIFIITHHSDIEIPNDDEIVVIKDESGISKVL